MMLLKRFVGILLLLPGLIPVFAQPKLEFQMKKPKQFEERKLGSEKNADKKFTVIRRFFQNTYTHFNYYYNANLKLDEIVAMATEQHRDDYTTLLDFYPYSLDVTAQSGELDSILLTGTAGILLHDLRNDWVDNMYMCIGRAYFLRKDFDSAAMTFQYVNYAFSPKEKGGYDKPIGSNAVEGSNAFSIATKEKRNVLQKTFSEAPSRNESFLWQVRTLIERNAYLDASSLLSTLNNDPNFPERLKDQLYEVTSYLYYTIEQWDSAAIYFEKALPTATSMEDKARRHYLLGQLYHLANMYAEASAAYEKASEMALDPVMDVYARLNMIRLRKSDDPGIIDKNIADLESMAKKDRYRNYKDIIYYAAALIEFERQGYPAAEKFLKQSIDANAEDPEQRTKSFFMLAESRYQQQFFGAAAMPYDSADVNYLPYEDSLLTLARRPGTKKIDEAENIIYLQDSLIRIAKMPEDERTDLVKQISKQLRKERGLQEDTDNANAGLVSPTTGTTRQGPSDMFSTGGTWYFDDQTRRTSGFNSFKERWGSRPNVDNWRRSATINISSRVNQAVTDPGAGQQVVDSTAGLGAMDTEIENFDTTDISFDNLYSRLPLSPEKQYRAEMRIINALYLKANALHVDLEEYAAAIPVFEEILARLDTGMLVEKSLFALIHCHTKTGNLEKASQAREALKNRFPGSKLASAGKPSPVAAKTTAATQAYQQVYDLFLEGNFQKALARKALADSNYGTNYWTPQLLYIEAVYYIREQKDSLAIKTLDDIIARFADHPLAEKAKTFKDVVGRRKQIEEYLTHLEVKRAAEDEIVIPELKAPERKLSYARQDSTPGLVKPAPDAKQGPTAVAKSPEALTVLKDSIPPAEAKAVTIASPYPLEPGKPQWPAIVLENIDPAYINEAAYAIANSPQKNYKGQNVEVVKKKLKDKQWLLVFSSAAFTNAQDAIDYIRYLKPINQKQLLSWLDVAKYRYIMVSPDILAQLEKDPNLPLYEQVLKQAYPDIF